MIAAIYSFAFVLLRHGKKAIPWLVPEDLGLILDFSSRLTPKAVTAEGRIDTITAPEFEKALVFDGVTDITVDLAKVDYISSAGLRVLVRATKKVGDGHVTIANASAVVREIFDVVGFADAFTFK